ncbi:uncharacterized protein LOC143830273 isoform X1 [Paroedura picta]|uniref:uncharacterized protein LOC143830273 isoform X1 n=1 Tax=Paroedura picta TaxID=143630 RepID=UPI0040565A45
MRNSKQARKFNIWKIIAAHHKTYEVHNHLDGHTGLSIHDVWMQTTGQAHCSYDPKEQILVGIEVSYTLPQECTVNISFQTKICLKKEQATTAEILQSAKHTNRKYCILPEMKTFGKTMVKWKILREEIFLSTLNLQGCLIQCQKIGQMQVVSQWSDSSGTLARPMMNRSRTHHAEISTFA